MGTCKKVLSLITAVMLITGLFTGCAESDNNSENNGKISVVTTIFPEYDWVKEIVKDNKDVQLTMLLDNGTDLHSYQPTANDIIKISDCDLFIYVGGESDGWAEDAIKSAKNKNMKVINLLDVLGDSVKEEEKIEGMQPEDEHDHGDEDEDDHENEGAHEEEPEYDEHVWLSLKNAKILIKKIASELISIDKDNADDYNQNTDAYLAKLDNLDIQYQQTVDTAKRKTVLFGDRFPFRYMVDDYGISYYAAFVGCSAETEASFETVVFLANKVDELELTSVLTLEGTKHKIAETIINNTKTKNQTVLSMDSMQSITSKDANNGTTYLSIMESNHEVLKKALN